VVEANVDSIVDADEIPAVREAVLLYAREVAFAAAEVYARAAETRGAWDARLEALIVDSVLRGEADEAVRSRAAALGWASASQVAVVVGHAPEGDRELVADAVRRSARQAGLDTLCAVQGDRLVVVLGGVADDGLAAAAVAEHFGPGPVVIGPSVPDLLAASVSARAAVSGHRAAAGWPDAPRFVTSDDLLPERALNGDGHARRQLVTAVYAPLQAAGPTVLETVAVFLERCGSIEATARALFVHPNTVRYRLQRVAEVTGLSAGDPREAYILRLALTLGRLLSPEG
jgi:DNA-binding PucR family transcriptional regulator